ncbi:hypothetical protein M405DRAFT_764608 [Rhizopogon salebrosus TDB-379]|nr:hypothetical protein M405DRAFT_764608 [Rhizopogon salebrosus TDB-379]
MATCSEYTCLNECLACGPSGTGCTCPKGRCNCQQCVNSKHSEKCSCTGTGENCDCSKQGQVCACESK